MHRLTISTDHAVTVTHHHDHASAHGHLMRHVVTADFYLHALVAGPDRSAYDLVAVADGRRPRRAGRAVIEEQS